MSNTLVSSITQTDILAFAGKIQRDLGPYIRQASLLTGVPETLILATAIKEIQNKPYSSVSGAGAVGVMQIKPLVVMDTIAKARMRNILDGDNVAFLKKKLGQNFDLVWLESEALGYNDLAASVYVVSWNAQNKPAKTRIRGGRNIFKSLLLDPEFNLYLGALVLRVLSIEHTYQDQINVAKVMLGYNQGYYALQKSSKLKGGITNKKFDKIDADSLFRLAPFEGKLYLRDTIGRNGIIQTLNEAATKVGARKR